MKVYCRYCSGRFGVPIEVLRMYLLGYMLYCRCPLHDTGWCPVYLGRGSPLQTGITEYWLDVEYD